MIQKSYPNEIGGIYWILFPDEDTLLVMIDELDGNIHLISNDCFYLQYALTEFAFKDRYDRKWPLARSNALQLFS